MTSSTVTFIHLLPVLLGWILVVSLTGSVQLAMTVQYIYIQPTVLLLFIINFYSILLL